MSDKPNSEKLFKDTLGAPMSLGRLSVMKGLGIDPNSLMTKPFIAVANSFTEINPGHIHLREIAQAVREGVIAAGGIPFEFNVPAPCDAVAEGNDGMRHILPQRDLIADSVETFVRSQLFDGVVLVSGCDKINPGMLMAAARLDLPAIFVPGGPAMMNIRFVKPGGSIDHKDHEDIFSKLQAVTCGTCGACEIMGTANTFQLLSEALGMALSGAAAIPAVAMEKRVKARASGERIVEMVREGLTTGRILTRKAIENAIMVDLAIGGSTNSTLHLPALAAQLGIEIDIDLFNKFATKIPTLLRIAPNGPHGVVDLYRAGGVAAVMKRLREDLHLDCATVGGKTIGEIIDEAQVLDDTVVYSKDAPVLPEGGTVALKGNLAPDGAVIKQSAVIPSMRTFEGKARVFNSEEDALHALQSGEIGPGTVIVIRYEGPKGGPGMPEMLSVTATITLMRLERVALVTDGRFSGATDGPCVGHVTPEAYLGGPLALLEDGDLIKIDIPNRSLSVALSPEELAQRSSAWVRHERPVASHYLKMYRKLVGPASKGAVLQA
ncbi:MAG: dihydroxy-acid dehydratase [Candidatus Abyssobacteria bacterium SURF_5]|uniref:Dihydroxy-acid dehydratase n=1 Tax=Abyssobacteria bacterium (strain SURF_5) TaxID=2093360 RepID=A0A3A4P0Y6_ABYX5|nr:MAG: dihydroxy-acid dehydratase [Candidatus Abyssubacteria bacterium SURF_5]